MQLSIMTNIIFPTPFVGVALASTSPLRCVDPPTANFIIYVISPLLSSRNNSSSESPPQSNPRHLLTQANSRYRRGP
jgi:hypothetical protein